MALPLWELPEAWQKPSWPPRSSPRELPEQPPECNVRSPSSKDFDSCSRLLETVCGGAKGGLLHRRPHTDHVSEAIIQRRRCMLVPSWNHTRAKLGVYGQSWRFKTAPCICSDSCRMALCGPMRQRLLSYGTGCESLLETGRLFTHPLEPSSERSSVVAWTQRWCQAFRAETAAYGQSEAGKRTLLSRLGRRSRRFRTTQGP